MQWAQRMEGQTEEDGAELTDEELEGVAGGVGEMFVLSLVGCRRI